MNNFKLETNFYGAIKPLNLEDKGRLLDALFCYAAGDPVGELPPMVNMAFTFIKSSIDQEKIKASSKSDKNRENAKKRWAMRTNANAENLCERIQSQENNAIAYEKCERITDNAIAENQKTKEKTPLNNPQENKNKNIYSPSTSDDVVIPPLPENDDSGMLDIEELIAMTPPKPKEKKFTPPTADDVAAYVADRKLVIDPKMFFDYFTAGKWKDSEGKPVKNWKQKALTWDSHERQRRTLAAARGLLPQKTAVASGSYDEGVPL